MDTINWNDIFEYRNGDLFWKDKGISYFKTLRAYRSWYCRFCGVKAGRIDPPKDGLQPYMRVRVFKKQYAVHRIIWEMFNKESLGDFLIDHIDGDGLNNKIENLRKVTTTQSAKNRPKSKTNKSGVVGVCFNKRLDRWVAYIGATGKLGSYKTFEEAVHARKQAEKLDDFHYNHGRDRRMR